VYQRFEKKRRNVLETVGQDLDKHRMTIVKYPDPVLKKKCRQVKKNDKKLKEVINKLNTGLKDSSNGIGLSAPQVGEDLCVFVIDHPEHNHAEAESDSVQTYINPEITDTFDKEKVYPQVYTEDGEREEFYEGCLSFPGIYGAVKRWMEIKVKYQTLNEEGDLEFKEEVLQGLTAIVFQHELDHLKGVLFVDHIKKDNGQIFKDTGKDLEELDIDDVMMN
jgi:peptide deformylase